MKSRRQYFYQGWYFYAGLGTLLAIAPLAVMSNPEMAQTRVKAILLVISYPVLKCIELGTALYSPGDVETFGFRYGITMFILYWLLLGALAGFGVGYAVHCIRNHRSGGRQS